MNTWLTFLMKNSTLWSPNNLRPQQFPNWETHHKVCQREIFNMKSLERRILYVSSAKRCRYGLKQSHRAWFQLIASVLVDFDFQQCESDPCIFIHKNADGQQTYITL